MGYKIIDVNSCTKKLSFEMGQVDLKGHIQKALSAKQKTSELKGYRKGKAPISVIEKLYGPQVENEALYRFIYDQIDQALKKEGINPLDYPKIEKTDYNAPALSFDAMVEFFPTLKIKDISKYSVAKDKATIKPEEITEARDRYLRSRSTLEEVLDVKYAAKAGDTVQINFEGIMKDGSRPENMKGNDYPLELGSSSFIKGFEEGLTGAVKGLKKNLTLIFPEDYHVDQLKNEEVTFEVEVLAIKQKKTPELTEELAKEFGFESVALMDKSINDNLMQQKDRAAKEKMEKEILEKLVEDHPFDVPETMVAAQKKSLLDQVMPGLTRSGFNQEQMTEYLTKWDKDMNERAKFQVKTAFILDQLSKDFAIEVSPADIEEKYKEISGSAGMSVDEVKNYYKKDQKSYRNLFFTVKEQKTFSKILDLVKAK